MRAISCHAKYSITVFSGEEQIVVDSRGYAQTIQLKKPVIAHFEASGLLDNEIEAALMSFTFAGLPEGVNPLTTMSVFDSEMYCLSFPQNQRDEMQVQIDERLRELQLQNKTDFIIVEPPEVAKPWPTYDENDIEEILALQSAVGANPEGVYRYELEHEHREDILAAMLSQYDPAQAAEKYGVVEASEEPILVQS
jgi:hypothetical protein